MDQESEDRKFVRTLIGGVLALSLLISIVFVATFLFSGQTGKSGTEVFQQTESEIQTEPAGQAMRNIKVTEGEMFIRLSSQRARVGRVALKADNRGTATHELLVIKTEKAADDLGATSERREAGMISQIPSIKPGQRKTLSTEMSPGHYALICNLPGHYEAGMHADLEAVK